MNCFKKTLLAILCLCSVLLLCGFGKSNATKYEDAKGYIINGDYAKAVTAFTELDGYEDSSKYLVYVKAIQLAENEQYDFAISALNTLGDFSDSKLLAIYYQAQQYEKNKNYEDADTLYRSIPTFKDSLERITLIPDLILDRDFASAKYYVDSWGRTKYMLELVYKEYSTDANKMKQQIYDTAQDRLENEDFDSAYTLFQALSSVLFSDSAVRVKDAVFAKAKYQMTNENYQSALDNLLSLTNYPAAEEAIMECRYQLALQSEQNGKYAEAYTLYVNLGDYNDCADRAARFESDYAAAQTLLDAGEYDSAKSAFEALYDYSDAQTKVKEANYQIAVMLRANGEYEQAISIFSELDDYSDAETQIYVTYYAEGEAKYKAGQYDDAVASFVNAGSYSDAETQIAETLYQKAASMDEAGDYAGAASLYENLAEYKDSTQRREYLLEQMKADTLFEKGDYAAAWEIYSVLPEKYQKHNVDYAVMYTAADEVRASGDYDNARAQFIALGNYSDAAKKATQCDIEKAEALFAVEKYTEAASVYASCGEEEKANEVIYYYAGVLAERGEYLPAAEQYAAILIYKDSREQHYQMGIAAKNNGDFASTYSIFMGDLDNPSVKEALYQLGLTTSSEKLYEISVSCFTAVGIYKDAAMRLTMDTYLWGSQLYDAGSYDKAAEIFASIGKISNASTRVKEAAYAAAAEAFENGSYADAKSRFDALRNYNDSAARAKESNYYYAKTLYEAEQYQEALNIFIAGKLSGYNDSSNIMNDCYYQLGAIAMQSENYAAARDWFDQAGSYHDSINQANACRYELAMQLKENSQYDEAISVFNKISTYGDSKEQITACYNEKGTELEQSGDYESAYTAYAKAENAEKMDEAAYQTALGKLSVCDYGKAIAWFEKCGIYSDAQAQIYFIGEYYFVTQQYDEAEKVYVKVADTDIAAQRLYELGEYYEQQGNLERAVKAYDEAGDYQDAPGRAKYTLGKSYEMKGDLEQAAKAYSEAGLYQDAPDKVKEMEAELDYQVAEALYNAGDYENAKTAYAKICGYKDADSKITSCENEIAAAAAAKAKQTEADYQAAEALFNAGDYENAKAAYAKISGYKDADSKITSCENEIAAAAKAKQTEDDYQAAEALFNAGDYESAKIVYAKISGYKDADSKIVFCENKVAFEAKWSVGNYVTFGTYPQTADGMDETLIEWLVLARDGNKALLISRYGLDAQPYNTSYTGITWETCTLRTWLNDAFMNKAFTSEEQKGIVLTNVDNSKSQGNSSWSTSGGNNTQDKIFLLSYAEANKYFGVTNNDSNNTKVRVEPTAYAIVQGARTSSSDKTASGVAAGWWWLRSPGFYQINAACVFPDGSLYINYVISGSTCVRPALWVNLESDIFQSGI